MKAYEQWDQKELLQEKESLEKQYQKFLDQGLSYNMARGRPCKEQLDLAMPMLDVLDGLAYYHTVGLGVRYQFRMPEPEPEPKFWQRWKKKLLE